MHGHGRDDLVRGVGEVRSVRIGVLGERIAQELAMGFELAVQILMRGFDFFARRGHMAGQIVGDARADLQQILSGGGQGGARQLGLLLHQTRKLSAGLDQFTAARLDRGVHGVDPVPDHLRHVVASFDEAAARVQQGLAHSGHVVEQRRGDHFACLGDLRLLAHENRVRGFHLLGEGRLRRCGLFAQSCLRGRCLFAEGRLDGRSLFKHGRVRSCGLLKERRLRGGRLLKQGGVRGGGLFMQGRLRHRRL